MFRKISMVAAWENYCFVESDAGRQMICLFVFFVFVCLKYRKFLFVILFYISLHFIRLGGETYQCRELRSLLIVWRRGRLVAMSGQFGDGR